MATRWSAAARAGSVVATLMLCLTGTVAVASPATPSASWRTTANPNGSFTTTVTFHPDIYGGAADWTEVNSAAPTYAGWHESRPVQVGACGRNCGVARAFFQFATGPSPGATILTSQLNFTEQNSRSCTVPHGHNGTVDLFVTGPVNAQTDWRNQPSRIGPAIGSTSAMDGHDPSNCPTAGVGFDVTNVVTAATGKGSSLITFGLRADDERDFFGWRQFSDTVTWSTTYDVPPATPTNPTTSPAMPCTAVQPFPAIGATDLNLSVQTPLASDGVVKPLAVDFTIRDAGGAVANDQTIESTAGVVTTETVRRGTLADGDYTWSATDTDGELTSGASPTCGFHIDTSQPSTPVITPVVPASCTSQDCSVPVRTPVTFTFSPGPGSTPAAYSYQLNSGAPITVTATSGSGTAIIKPPKVGPNMVTVRALSGAGTPSVGSAQFQIFGTPVVVPDGDFNGDGHPDLLTVGSTNGVPSGLWLSPGDGTGHLGTPVDIGVNGTGRSSGPGSPSDWNGVIVTHGEFFDDGNQDILAVFPSSGGGQTVTGYTGTGDGSPLGPTNSNGLVGGCLTDPAGNCLSDTETITQVTAVGHLPEDSCAPDCPTGRPDLFAVVDVNGSNQLWWYQAQSFLFAYTDPVVLDSNLDWSTKQISGTIDNGEPALEVRDTATGEIDLYATNSTSHPNGDLNWFTDATKITMTPTSTGGTRIDATDANGDGQPDLWATLPNGDVTYYPGVGGGALGTPVNAGSIVSS